MRIKLFENFEENLRFKYNEDKLRTDIDGILVELLDKGFRYEVNFKKNLEINIEHSQDDWFFFDKIYEEIMMLIDYMKLKYKDDIDVIYNYEEYNESSLMRTKEWKKNVMNKENKHFLMSYFEIDFKIK
jgi:hypothetical protein